MNKADLNILSDLFFRHFDEVALEINKLPASGSVREYFRIKSDNRQVIGAFNKDVRENNAFFSFSQHFKWLGFNVPEIYCVHDNQKYYLLEDLGDITLYKYITENRDNEQISTYYKKVVENLAEFQFLGFNGLDFNVCYPRKVFDKQSMMWDLNYFKHYFVKLAGVVFDEQALENDFQTFTSFLHQAGNENFMFRDFQSRNIMLHKNNLYYIDYQGGRKGPVQYDLASLLFDAKANLSSEFRNQVLDYYLEFTHKNFGLNPQIFMKFFHSVVLIRIMQAFGAYGYRGFFERKTHFLQSIPYALKNLEWLLSNHKPDINLPELFKVFEQLIVSPNLKELNYEEKEGLTVEIISFSYKHSIPLDNTGNGGGFVFDCRFLPNPGRLPEYAELNGNDQRIIDYLESKQEVIDFKNNVFAITDSAISNYLSRKFTHLMISFGCTGGQHRSVYFANKTVERYLNTSGVNIRLKHIELDK